ncbi:MAG TPA: hypothetical protein VLU73_17550 [Methylococcaceae bacterium]|jgi:hypothetical protein|nr:hypothetical protein [Methylococcaceae bacterium]
MSGEAGILKLFAGLLEAAPIGTREFNAEVTDGKGIESRFHL